MSKIVDKYIELDELFKQCVSEAKEENVQFEQLHLYQEALNSFINEARIHYSNNDLDLSLIMVLFNSDTAIQEELSQYKNQKTKIKSHNINSYKF